MSDTTYPGAGSGEPGTGAAPTGTAGTETDRRDFLLKLGTGAGVAAITVQAAASLRSLVPNVSYDAPTTVKLGPPTEFPEGLKFLPDERLLVFRDGNTFHAISAVCTHLGCTVRAEPLPTAQSVTEDNATIKLTHRFLCPCHGSQYRGDGTNVAGPAPKPLAWYRLSLAPDDGQLVVDLADQVERDFRLTVG
jgi:cytochrome b6-f complex iron-sulfur subunit